MFSRAKKSILPTRILSDLVKLAFLKELMCLYQLSFSLPESSALIRTFKKECALHTIDKLIEKYVSNRAAGQLWECLSRDGVERKHPFSPLPAFLVHNWSGVCQLSETHPQSSSKCQEHVSSELGVQWGRGGTEKPWSPW